MLRNLFTTDRCVIFASPSSTASHLVYDDGIHLVYLQLFESRFSVLGTEENLLGSLYICYIEGYIIES